MKYTITVDIKDEEGVVEFDVHTGDGTPVALKGMGFKGLEQVLNLVLFIIEDFAQKHVT